MSNERAILCGTVRSDSLPFDDIEPLKLRMWGPHRNIRLRIEDVRKAMFKDVPTVFLDLIDIATYVYTADQAVRRGGGGLSNPAEIGQDWRRNLFFRIPVRNPDVWNSSVVRDQLVSSLSFVSEDTYQFEFEHLKKDTSLAGYLDFGGTPYDSFIEEVVLFSGGLDSLAGAVQESIVDKRNVLLVNHRPTGKLTPRHQHLLTLLKGHAKDHPPLHLPVRMNKAKKLGREHTQRVRSFVYTALAATIATMIGLDRIRFYENGVISLNLPPSAQVVGARATRTTHPQTLSGLAKLLSSLAGKPFAVENPFLWKTKTDTVKLIGDLGCGNLIRYTTSCAHTWELTNQHSHCGGCSQCIDRRFAVLAAEQGANDPSEAYGVDLLVGSRSKGNRKTMLAAYLETANEINSMSAVQFFSRYGEATRVLGEVGERPDVAAQHIFELYKRHAKQVTEVVDRAIVTYASAIRSRELPPSCMVRLVCDSTFAGGGDRPPETPNPPDQPSPEVAPALPDHLFRKKGQVWELRFAGGRVNILLPSKGAAYLHILLSKPHTAIRAVELACRVAQCRGEYSLADVGERIDQEALTAYRARLAELREDLDNAKRNNDVGAQTLIEAEIAALVNEIRRATGLGGKIRKELDDRDRVRKSVGNAIRRAVDEISQFDNVLADHLKSPRITCGLRPCYRPMPDVEWETREE